jgi:hypothetical protein
LVKDFLAKNNVKTLEDPPYSRDLGPPDIYLFAQLKSTLKGRRFCVAIDIIKHATEELKRPSQNGFYVYFQHFHSHWQNCIVAQVDYF